MAGTVKIGVDIRDPLIDDVITIRVSGLAPNQRVTVKAELRDRGVVLFSFGCFTADMNGVVDVSKTPSEQGTYIGLSPMGLFWSMDLAPNQPAGTYLRSHNASLPFVYNVEVYDGHLDLVKQFYSHPSSLCTTIIKRWYMAKGVQRTIVRCGRIRGSLFLPPGPGPFAGVIDMFASGGSLVDFRGALLASRGFAVLCLAYYLYDDLPTDLKDLNLEYFMEAAEWLSNHRFVITDQLGVLGQSKGGEIALQLAYYCSKVKAVVSISGAPFLTHHPMKFRGNRIGESELYPERTVNTPEGASFKNIFNCSPEKYLPLWETEVHVLLVAGGDDLCLDPIVLQQYHDRFPADMKHKCQLLFYDGAGHLIDPPYFPHFLRTRRTLKTEKDVNRAETNEKGEVIFLWGGQKIQHAHAQEDSWRHILEYFRKHLRSNDHQERTCLQHQSKL